MSYPWHFQGKAILIGMSFSIRLIPVILLGFVGGKGWIWGCRQRGVFEFGIARLALLINTKVSF
jgi:hypothetical protein